MDRLSERASIFRKSEGGPTSIEEGVHGAVFAMSIVGEGIT
jgi:hypothetical protein